MSDSTMNVEKSTHRVEVIQVNELLKHENADTLSKVKIYDYTTVVRTAEWKVGDLAAWVPPDSVINVELPVFSFLAAKAKNGKVRIRASKLRGITSYGLLVKAPEGSKVGDDVAELLQVQHWEPEIDIGYGITGGEVAKAPSGVFYTYDVDSFQRWGREVFVENEPVSVTEKINGCNGRYVYKDGIFHCGSRGEWKKEFPSKPTITLDDLVKQYNGDAAKAQNAYRKIENWKPQRNLWWIAADNTPTIKDFCIANPNFAIYGEVYGAVGGWTYNVKGKYQFMAFDILSPDGKWLDFPDFLALCRQFNVPTVPIIHEQIPFNFEEMVQMAEGNSVIDPGQIKEGIVLAPIKNRWDERLGRVKLKVINSAY